MLISLPFLRPRNTDTRSERKSSAVDTPPSIAADQLGYSQETIQFLKTNSLRVRVLLALGCYPEWSAHLSQHRIDRVRSLFLDFVLRFNCEETVDFVAKLGRRTSLVGLWYLRADFYDLISRQQGEMVALSALERVEREFGPSKPSTTSRRRHSTLPPTRVKLDFHETLPSGHPKAAPQPDTSILVH